MLTEPKELKRRLDSLVIFRDLIFDPAIRELRRALKSCDARGGMDGFLYHIAAFEAVLFDSDCQGDWSRYLSRLILESENICVKKRGQEILTGEKDLNNNKIKAILQSELLFLQDLSQLDLNNLVLPEFLPDWFTGWDISPIDIPGEYDKKLKNIGETGYGVFSRYHVFMIQDGNLIPVSHPDPQELDDLPGYEREREKILANTEALLSGQSASNVLLYGDAGTGKSSAVKAIVNKYYKRGLRLVEVKKNQLYQLPGLMDELAENPLKFIIFIDDLSFTVNDDNFSALKAILEGGAGGRAGNVAVYATSNRRHLIKENLSDREGDDIHAADTRQELMSLAARFGLTVTFSVPDREKYLYIVSELAKRRGLDMPEKELFIRAEAFAIRAGGRSARVAKQFIELCAIGVLHS